MPGGPGRDADYLEGLADLGSRTERQLIVMEARGTGASPRPTFAAGYSAACAAEDLEDLRLHLGLESMDVVAHSVGCTVAFLYAAAHPDRVSRMLLITPSTRALQMLHSAEEWERQQAKRRHEPWFPDAARALEEIEQSGFTAELRQRMSPLLYGSWTERAQAHAASDSWQRNPEAAAHLYDDLPDATLLRTKLARVTAPVRIIIGELDMAPGPDLAAAIANLFPTARSPCKVARATCLGSMTRTPSPASQ